MSAAQEFDWDFLMRLGLGALGLAPRDFWHMTPREFEAALKGRLGQFSDVRPLAREELGRLADRFLEGDSIR